MVEEDSVATENFNKLLGKLQDRLRREGYQVIRGSAFGDRLESDRSFGQDQLKGHGLRTAHCARFTDFGAAIELVRASPSRYVFKSNGADSLRTRNYIGEMHNGADMIALLSTYQARWRGPGEPDFILMEHVQGIEVGVGRISTVIASSPASTGSTSGSFPGSGASLPVKWERS
jgi:phosphoribosylamine--glycine ligase